LRETSDSVVSIDDLRVETLTHNPIIDEVSLRIGNGEVLALVGESGSGKTTLAMALLGHTRRGTRIAHGSVVVGGIDLLRIPAHVLRRIRGSRISYVPQDPTSGLNPRHRVGNQLTEVLLVHGTQHDAAQHVAFDLLERVGLPADRAFARRYPFELSGGQQQRIAIAMALACKPAVVVLDEPTTGLDVTTQALVLKLIRELSRELSATFVYVTHDLAVVDGLADSVCIMYAGRIIERGPRARVFGTPGHPYSSMLLASVPMLGEPTRLSGIPGTAPPPGSRPPGCFFEPRCPSAIDVCRTEFPPETRLAGDHAARCWRAAEVSARVETEPREMAQSHPGDRLLHADRLRASYGKEPRRHLVLHDVSFSIAAGECLAVVGESGSGKTTLGRCVAGLHLADGGDMLLHGDPLEPAIGRRSRRDRRAIQLVYQNPDRSLNPRESVGEAIARPLRLYGVTTRAGERQEIMRLLERVRLPKNAVDRYPAEFSGGEKQRIAIARALAPRPELLVCDEVTSSLDVSIQAAVVALLEELRQDGLALLFITHNLALVNSLADRVLVLEQGRVRDYGATSSVIGQPTDPYTKQLVAAVPRLSYSREEEMCSGPRHGVLAGECSQKPTGD
jgi:peptide/nickel transport system ATP-binding protein